MSKFNIGDIITAYRAGYHEIVNIKNRWRRKDDKNNIYWLTEGDGHNPADRGVEASPLIIYKPLFRENGTPIRKPKQHYTCDAGFCKLAKQALSDKIQNIRKTLEMLENFEKQLP